MGNQGDDNWYPECSVCGAGNLGDVVCKSCYDKFKSDLLEKIKKEKKKNQRFLNGMHVGAEIKDDTLEWVLGLLGENHDGKH